MVTSTWVVEGVEIFKTCFQLIKNCFVQTNVFYQHFFDKTFETLAFPFALLFFQVTFTRK